MSADSCRLCLCSTIHPNDQIPCFGDNSVADILRQHFWIQLHPDQDTGTFVCTTCWAQVQSFHRFYISLLELHQSREALDQSPEHLQKESVIRANEKPVLTEAKESAVSEDNETNNGDALGSALNDDDTEEEDLDGIDKEPRQPLTTRRRSGRTPKSGDSMAPEMCATESADTSDHPQRALLAQFFTLQCDLCATPLPDLLAARHHHRVAHKQRGYLVCRCGKPFVRDSSVREHCRFHTNGSPWKCQPCCKIFASERRLLVHRRQCHATSAEDVEEEEVVVEKVPGTRKPLPGRRNLREDDELLRRFVAMVCGQCGEKCDKFAGVMRHFRQQHPQQTGYVECCGKRFLKKWSAVAHCRWHEDPKAFDCPLCHRHFNDHLALTQHRIRRHPSPTNAPFSYPCPSCPARFQMNQLLRQHQRSEHPQPTDRLFECFICHRQFLLIDRLRNHVRHVHDASASFVCEVCARCFKSRTTYDLHWACEHGGRSLKCQCPECGRWLKHPAMLRWHQLQHRSQPQSCDQCGHRAPTRLALRAHQRLNHTERRHRCVVCDKRVRTPLALREHMAIHTGRTDLYACAYCPRTFRSIANMYKHRRLVHGAQFEVDRRAARLALDERNRAEVEEAEKGEKVAEVPKQRGLWETDC